MLLINEMIQLKTYSRYSNIRTEMENEGKWYVLSGG